MRLIDALNVLKRYYQRMNLGKDTDMRRKVARMLKTSGTKCKDEFSYIVNLLTYDNGWHANAVSSHILAFVGNTQYREMIPYMNKLHIW